MFQTKQKLVEANAKIDTLWAAALEHRNDLREAYEHAASLSAANSAQSLTVLAQTQELALLRKKCEELAAHIKKLNDIPTQFSSGPLWMSEEEEDARYSHESGNINGDMLRDKLLEMGLDPDITAE